MLFQSLKIAPFSTIIEIYFYTLTYCLLTALTVHSSLLPPYFLPHSLHFNFYANNSYLYKPLLYHIRMLVPFICNTIGCIHNVANGILLHINIWFAIELAHLLLLSCASRPVVRNTTSTLTVNKPARTQNIIQWKNYRLLNPQRTI
jgi:hypothetical protein